MVGRQKILRADQSSVKTGWALNIYSYHIPCKNVSIRCVVFLVTSTVIYYTILCLHVGQWGAGIQQSV
jgi:hypothetical protein